VRSDAASDDLPPGPEPPAPDRIQRVLRAPVDERHATRLTTIVVRERHTHVRWLAVAVVADDQRVDGLGHHTGLCLIDDAGTDYGDGADQLVASSTGSGLAYLRGFTRFDAPVPPEARELRLTWGGDTSVIAVAPLDGQR
jgi:hypothetical protein